MNFISCVKWVKQGATKSVPDDVNLNEDELREIVDEVENESCKDENSVKEKPASAVTGDEYDFENYDNEEDNVRVSLKGIVTFDKPQNKNRKSKKKKRNRDSSSENSDREDEVIKDDDNLILVGHVDNDLSTMDIYVYNETDGDMYIHHDLVLKSPPLCVEWLNLDNAEGYSNMCAIGGMKPVIEIWDLDILNCVEPIFKLGRSKKKNPHKNFGHTDAVLSITWNTELTHVLCSGSVDQRGLLWDLHSGEVATEITVFTNKVQTLLFNPHNPYYLLTGCADGYLRNFDCRLYDEFQKFNLNSAIESIIWDTSNEFSCFAGTEDGSIHNIDFRANAPVWSFEGHKKEVTGLGINKNNPKILVSISTDECVKFWDVDNRKVIYSKDAKLGALHCIDMNPNYSYLACIGGSSESNNKKILNVMNINEVFNSITQYGVVTTLNNVFSEIPLLEETQKKTKKPKENVEDKKKKKLKKRKNKKEK